MAYTYIVQCNDDTLYTGIAKDIKQRMKEHINKSPKAKYTRSRGVKQLCALWQSDTLSDAAKLEYAIKQLKRSQKLELIEYPHRLGQFISSVDSEKYIPLAVFDIFVDASD